VICHRAQSEQGDTLLVLKDQGDLLGNQYGNAQNLNARLGLHARFSADSYPWFRWVFDLLDAPAGGRVLELGCGTGSLWVENLDRIPLDWEITLSDFSPGMLDAARRNLKPTRRLFDFRVVDAQDLPFAERSFDAVIANHMLYHVPDRRKAFSEISRTLKPAGRLYAATNGCDHMRELDLLIGRITPQTVPETIDFTLQGEAQELRDWFGEVVFHERQSHLSVDEVQPLVDYVRSYHSLTEAQTQEMTVIIERELSEKGAFYISTSVGLFVAGEPKQVEELR
jgi:ubiquinone/menaquinone biosynthesis C-methylase UbiE